MLLVESASLAAGVERIRPAGDAPGTDTEVRTVAMRWRIRHKLILGLGLVFSMTLIWAAVAKVEVTSVAGFFVAPTVHAPETRAPVPLSLGAREKFASQRRVVRR